MAQQPKVEKVMMTDKRGNPILDSNKKPIITTEYHYTNNKGENIIIQNHSAGHSYPDGTGNQGPHYKFVLPRIQELEKFLVLRNISFSMNKVNQLL
jgi:hypothetical protein